MSMVRANTTLDDIAAVIGFSATLRLVAWYGDQDSSLWVPVKVSEDHALGKLIGVPCMTRLVGEWGGELLKIPTMDFYEDDCRNRSVRDLLARGLSPREIARLVYVGERRIQQVRMQLEETGMLPLILGKKPE